MESRWGKIQPVRSIGVAWSPLVRLSVLPARQAPASPSRSVPRKPRAYQRRPILPSRSPATANECPLWADGKHARCLPCNTLPPQTVAPVGSDRVARACRRFFPGRRTPGFGQRRSACWWLRSPCFSAPLHSHAHNIGTRLRARRSSHCRSAIATTSARTKSTAAIATPRSKPAPTRAFPRPTCA